MDHWPCLRLQKLCFLSHLRAIGNNFAISGNPKSKNHKSVMDYSLLSNVSGDKIYLIYHWASLYPINWLISQSLVFVTFIKIIEWKKFASHGTWTRISSVNSCCVTTYTKTQNSYNESITGHKKPKKLDNVKIGNLKKSRDHKNVPRQDTGNLQILLHLRSLFWLMLFKINLVWSSVANANMQSNRNLKCN